MLEYRITRWYSQKLKALRIGAGLFQCIDEIV
jgi:hypothetical protein